MKASDLDAVIDCFNCGGDGEVQAGTEVVQTTGEDSNPTGTEEVAVYETCELCQGNGSVNHYSPNDPSPASRPGMVLMDAEYSADGLIFKKHYQPISDPEAGGFNELMGPDTVDRTRRELRDAGVDADLADQLTNQPLGTNAGPDGYEIHGKTYSAGDLPGGQWPADGDLTPQQAVAFLRNRDHVEPGGHPDAYRVEAIVTRLGL